MTKKDELECLVYKYAMTMQMLTGVHFSCHLAKARKVVLLIEKMKSGTVTFTYVGQDGVERTVRGTLTRYEKDFKKPYRTNPDSWFIVYYNTEVEGWRAFQVTGIVESSK